VQVFAEQAMDAGLERNLEQFHLALSEGRQNDARAQLRQMQQAASARNASPLQSAMRNELVGACERKILYANIQEMKECCKKAEKGSTGGCCLMHAH
jgi:hypothetical protein